MVDNNSNNIRNDNINCIKPIDKDSENKSEIVSSFPEWNENIQKIVVGYH